MAIQGVLCCWRQMIQVHRLGEEKKFHPKEVSSIVLCLMSLIFHLRGSRSCTCVTLASPWVQLKGAFVTTASTGVMRMIVQMMIQTIFNGREPVSPDKAVVFGAAVQATSIGVCSFQVPDVTDNHGASRVFFEHSVIEPSVPCLLRRRRRQRSSLCLLALIFPWRYRRRGSRS